jgi:hypothetical protein
MRGSGRGRSFRETPAIPIPRRSLGKTALLLSPLPRRNDDLITRARLSRDDPALLVATPLDAGAKSSGANGRGE